MKTHLAWGYTPHLEVVWPHEQIGNPLAHVPDDPLIKVLGLRIGLLVSSLCGSDETI